MRHIIEKANEIREKYGIDDLELLASKLGAEVVEIPLGKIIKEVYIKDEGVIVIDPNLHPYKKRAFNRPWISPPPIPQKHKSELFSR
jgi:hypothetical protein